jgi:hypothetical protein
MQETAVSNIDNGRIDAVVIFCGFIEGLADVEFGFRWVEMLFLGCIFGGFGGRIIGVGGAITVDGAHEGVPVDLVIVH